MEAKRKRTKNIIIAAVLVVIAILMAALPAMLSSGQKEENTGTAKSVAVQRGDIDSTVAGAGTLSGGDGVKITVPHGVEITEYLVANGDVVAEGQALATVDKTSVMNTIATVQNNLEYLAGQVRTAASGATNAYLAAPAAGRVKAIYANAGDDVQSVIREHGALMVVSLDGRMAVDAETASDAATPGKSVTVRCEDGTEYAGRIEIRRGNTLTVTLTDNGPVLGAKADILLDGETVGTGTLYAHSAWNVTAAAGTVAGVNTAVERQITQGATVLTLRDVDAEAVSPSSTATMRTRCSSSSGSTRPGPSRRPPPGACPILIRRISASCGIPAPIRRLCSPAPPRAFRRNTPSVRRFSPRSRSAA